MHATRPLHTLLIAATLGCVGAASASAGNVFFVQVGNAATEAEAATKWQELSKAHPDQLGSLAVAVRRVMAVGGGNTEYRVQGGPAKSKLDAQRICSALQAQSVDCFIVEAAVGNVEPQTAPQAPAEASAAPASAPAQPAQITATSEEDYPEEGILGWLVGLFASDDKGTSATAEAKPENTASMLGMNQPSLPAGSSSAALPWLTAAQEPAVISNDAPAGNVEVAEAIPVPVSETFTPATPVYANAPAPAVFAPVEEAGWVRVSGFNTEQEAFDFSEAMHKQVVSARDLRARIIRSLGAHNALAPVSLRLGPVPSDAVSADICYFAARTSPALRCNAAHVGGEISLQPAAPQAVLQPAQQAIDSAPAAPVPSAAPQDAMENLGQYFVQLGAWRSRAEAMMQWDALMESHADLLKNQKVDLQTPERMSVNAKPNVRLRTGPFDRRNDAEILCGKLSSQGVNCIVVRN